jgi:hypothetical protein
MIFDRLEFFLSLLCALKNMKFFVPNTAVFDSFSFNFNLMLNSTLALNLLQNDVEHIWPIVAEFPL